MKMAKHEGRDVAMECDLQIWNYSVMKN